VSETAHPPVRQRHRGRIAIAVLLALLGGLVWLAWTALQPANLMPRLLAQLGRSTGLVITARGEVGYSVRGVPEVVLHDVDARMPGATIAVLTADRVHVAVPWSTLRSRGTDLVIDRVELDHPRIDLAEFTRWRASRPPSKQPLPRIPHGIALTEATLVGSGWNVMHLDATFPSFAEGAPVQGHLRGTFSNAGIALPFDVDAAMTRPDTHAGVAVIGTLAPTTRTWSIPARIRMRGAMAIDGGRVTLRPGTLGASMTYVAGTTRIPLVVGIRGNWSASGDGLAIDPASVALRAQDAIPSFDAHGRVAMGDRLELQLEGVLPRWLDVWPKLPAPLDRSHSALPFALDYSGTPAFDDPMHLRLTRDATRFDGRFRVRDVSAWTQANARGTPIPPIDGTLTTPTLVVGSATLEGVEIHTDDPSVQPAR